MFYYWVLSWNTCEMIETNKKKQTDNSRVIFAIEKRFRSGPGQNHMFSYVDDYGVQPFGSWYSFTVCEKIRGAFDWGTTQMFEFFVMHDRRLAYCEFSIVTGWKCHTATCHAGVIEILKFEINTCKVKFCILKCSTITEVALGNFPSVVKFSFGLSLHLATLETGAVDARATMHSTTAIAFYSMIAAIGKFALLVFVTFSAVVPRE